ncbi:hypothetical protein BDZ94DRAFT_1188752 [Collybia nuda]|uniref:Protein-S-isoprenylcysteine O-methyltransferase n=1 Tax=Collybia nuda TaxID=64659 RepID=A0A9P6CGV8_9AGAR|nr:hypothetical protein BDZ94DRAFT_1188752 [Collybia nuda]
MSLLKLPCILAATIGLYHSFTPPNVSKKSEQTSRKNILEHIAFAARSVTRPLGLLVWIVGITEAMVIVANHFPSWSLSEPIIATLLVRNNPMDLQLTPLSIIGLLLIMSGTLIREYCYRSLSYLFTFEISIRKGHRLITNGPYRVVRHPSYTGMVFVLIGMFCWCISRGSWLRESGVLETTGGKVFFGSVGMLLMVVLSGLLRRMSVEDAALKKEFGKEWTEWSRRVPYSLIPRVY